MEIPQRKLNRLSEYDYGQEGAYFVTLCTQNRSRLFQMELPVGNGLCAVPDGVGGGNGTTHRSCPTVPFRFYAAASSMFSIKMPYPVVGSFTRT